MTPRVSFARATAPQSLSWLLLSILLTSAALAGQDEPRLRALDAFLPIDGVGKDRDGAVVRAFRLVDARTGRAVAGAEVFAVEEASAPVAAKFWFTHRVLSDGDGFVRVPQRTKEQPWSWLIVRAPGFGPAGLMSPDLVWPLSPGVDVEIAVRDWLDRPVPKAGLGLCVGCGHTPDVANAVTDAAGIARFPCIDPHNPIADFYPEHPHLSIEDYDGVWWWPGDPPAFVRAPSGAPRRGRVYDEHGNPAAGVFVGVPDKHRGPWTATAADGTFQLDGVRGEWDLYVRAGAREFIFERTSHPDAELRIPAANGDRTQVIQSPPRDATATLRAVLALPDGTPARDIAVAVIGPEPWLDEQAATTTADGTLAIDTQPGDYELECRDAAFAHRLGRVHVPRDGSPRARFVLERLPTVRLRVPRGANVALLEAGKCTDVTDAAAAGRALPVRADRPFGFHLRDDATLDERWFVGTPAMLQQAEPIELAFFPPTRITGRIVDAGGKPVAARAALLGPDDVLRGEIPFDPRAARGTATADGAFAFEDRGRSGLAFLAIVPAAADQPPLLLPIHLPWRGPDARLDLGAIALSGALQLAVRDTDGKPLARERIGFFRAGWTNVQERELRFRTDTDGRWLGPKPEAGDAIVVPAAHWDLDEDDQQDGALDLPFRTVLAGGGPWTITVPGGELEVDVAGADGSKPRAVVFVQDRSVAFAGQLRLRQLPPGPMRLWIATESHPGMAAEVVIPARGRARLHVPLR
jgi:hypothetical protein